MNVNKEVFRLKLGLKIFASMVSKKLNRLNYQKFILNVDHCLPWTSTIIKSNFNILQEIIKGACRRTVWGALTAVSHFHRTAKRSS